MTEEKAPAEFLELSVALTGYDAVDLLGTGLVDQYWTALRIAGDKDHPGQDVRKKLMVAWEAATKAKGPIETGVRQEIMSDVLVGPVARNLIKMWYLGQWDRWPPDKSWIPSAEAYKEGLVWDAIGAHPQAAKQEGFGTWQFKPRSQS